MNNKNNESATNVCGIKNNNSRNRDYTIISNNLYIYIYIYIYIIQLYIYIYTYIDIYRYICRHVLLYNYMHNIQYITCILCIYICYNIIYVECDPGWKKIRPHLHFGKLVI